MEIYILDKEINVIGVVSTYESVLWITKFYEPGMFKATFAFTDHLNRRLKCGNLLYKTDDEEAGIITRKYLKLNKKGEQTIQVQGYMSSRYLNRRIIWDKTVLSGTPEMAMRRLVYEQVITPHDAARRIPGIELGKLKEYAGSINKQVTYDNLQKALTEIAMTNSLGYQLRLDIAQKCFFFEVLQGENRTQGSSHPCIFSRDFLNVYTQDYSEDDSNYKNICLVGGVGEDTDRTLATVGEAAGINRYELFYDASTLLDADIEKTEYISQLCQKGLEKLESYALAQAFDIKINQHKAMPYNLGDYVTCTDEQWGLTVDAQITAIEKGYSKAEESCVVTLGRQVPTLIDLIKAKE